MVRSLLGLFVVAALITSALAAFWFLSAGDATGPDLPPTFVGESDHLQQTAIVPTLDTPIPDGQSAVWCASFQLAWDKLKAEVVKGPVEITNAKTVCDRLNKAGPVADDLPADGSYSAAGFEQQGIRATIAAEMARRFPKAPPPELSDFQGDGIHAYAYLEANVRFKHPYLANPRNFDFYGPKGDSHSVESFGIPPDAPHDKARELREQPALLFAKGDENFRTVDSFAIDLDRQSRPIQVIFARISRKATLAESVAEFERRIRAFASDPSRDGWELALRNGTLLVPNMRWKVRHQFGELLGPDKVVRIAGAPWRMVDAEQVVAFRLDPRGASVQSSARVAAVKGLPVSFQFDFPFLLYLKKRDAPHPFFVMWVENAELLCPSQP